MVCFDLANPRSQTMNVWIKGPDDECLDCKPDIYRSPCWPSAPVGDHFVLRISDRRRITSPFDRAIFPPGCMARRSGSSPDQNRGLPSSRLVWRKNSFQNRSSIPLRPLPDHGALNCKIYAIRSGLRHRSEPLLSVNADIK